MPYVSPACTPFQLLCLKMSAYYHVTSIISNIVTVICKSQELHLMCFRSPHISFFLLSHCQHHLPTVSSDLHTFMVLLRFAQIISVFNSLLSWRNLHVLLDFQKHKTTLVTIPFTPTRPVTNNAAGIFHKFSNLLSYLHTAYSHCLLLLPLFPSLPASSCSFHSIALSFTLHTYEWLLVLSGIQLHAGVLGYVFCPILMPPQLLQQSATSAGLAWSVTQPSLPL